MVISIHFPKRGKGYIYSEENKHLEETLIGNTFMFDSKKPNIIIGPNTSGKSTLIRCIACNALTRDGWTKYQRIYKTDDYKLHLDNIETEQKQLIDYGFELSNITSIMKWDGTPVYYENIKSKLNNSDCGTLTGDLFTNMGQEMAFRWDKQMMSGGETMGYVFRHLCDAIRTPKILDEVFDRLIDRGEDEYQYIRKNYGEGNGQNTLLIDECDEHLDMRNAYNLWSDTIPYMCEKFGIQIIAISHHPIFLNEKIREKYNVIELLDGYLEDCERLMNLKRL